MAKLTQIFIYPIKGLPGIGLIESLVLPKGLQFDRRFMLVDETGNFITQRQLNSLVYFQLKIQDNELVIHHPAQIQSLVIPLQPTAGKPIEVKVWSDLVIAFEPNAMYSEWFSNCLNLKCSLVFMPENASRPIEEAFNRGNDTVSFADGFPFLLTNTASLSFINEHVSEQIPMNRFRPNFVFDGTIAFEEDNIDEFCIGDLLFKAARPCGRCKVITINQESGEHGVEPLKTLQKFRSKNNQVYFGENTLLLSPKAGIVSIGMDLKVISYK